MAGPNVPNKVISEIPVVASGDTAHQTPVATAPGVDNVGNATQLNLDSSGNLKVAVTGAGSGGTSAVDKSAFTAGTSAGTPLMGVTTPTDVGLVANELAIAALDANRNLKVNVVAGGAGGGAVTVADGADVAEGATTDAANTTGTTGTISGKLRGLVQLLAQAFNLATPLRVDPVGSTTQPVSAASLPLPTGASTAAKQPALGTAGSASTDVLTVQGIASMTPVLVTQTPAASGGVTIYRLLSAASTNGNNIKNGAGQLFGFVFTNTNASPRFVKLYNKATAPTVGTDTPVLTFVVPGNASGAGMVAADFSSGIAFATGLGIGITTGVADNDTGAVAANEVVVNLFYK